MQNQDFGSFRGINYPSESQLLQKSQSPQKKKIFQEPKLYVPSNRQFPSTFENVKNPMNDSNASKSFISNVQSQQQQPSQTKIVGNLLEENQFNQKEIEDQYRDKEIENVLSLNMINPLDITDEENARRDRIQNPLETSTNERNEKEELAQNQNKNVGKQQESVVQTHQPKDNKKNKKATNLLEVNQQSHISTDSTKINPFSTVYKSQLTLGMQNHICPVNDKRMEDSLGIQTSKKIESFSCMSFLYSFSMLLDFSLVCMFLTLLFPCYLCTIPTQIKKMPKRMKKICTNCNEIVHEAEINSSQVPEPIYIIIKISLIGLYFLLWKLMGYPFQKLYLDLILYIYKLLSDFFSYAVNS